MPLQNLLRPRIVSLRISQMAAQLSINGSNGKAKMDIGADYTGETLEALPKSNNFTTFLPPDPEFKVPITSFNASREDLGPRMVKGALYTYVRPEETESPEILGISHRAMKDLGLRQGEETTEDFKDMVAGNKIFWDEETETGIYPWAQCYGGTRFSGREF